MTTDNKPAATAEQDDGLRKSIEQAVQETEDSQDAPLTAAQLDGILDEKLKPTLDRVQGRAQQFYGTKLKEETEALRSQSESELASVIDDFSQVLDEDQRHAFTQLREQRAAQVQQARVDQALSYVEQQQSQQPAQQQVAMTTDEIELLNEEANDVIEVRGLEGVTHQSPELWKGWQQSMTFAQSLALMKRNARALKTAAPPANPATPPADPPARAQDAVPPSITEAPVVSDPGVMSLGEAAAAVRQGGLTATEFRALGVEKGWFR